MDKLDVFKSFAKQSNAQTINIDGKAVIYTRVSTKEQAETNASLETQKKYCLEFASRKNIEVIESFGGTYESAKSDERIHFQKMLSFVKRKKDISYIIVYSYDRFSRTGANGAYISEQLKKQGVVTLSATQEVDAMTAAGSFQQNLYYMFSQFDNELRRDKTVSGMKEKLRKGYWIGSIPRGYTNLNPGRGNEQKIVINEDGKILRNAFIWKASEDLSHQEISKRLAKKGYHVAAKKLSDVFRNPFYCGVIVSSHIPGEVIDGKHEAFVSKEIFLKVNNLLNKTGYGEKKNKDCKHLPLKKFVKSADCGTAYTGYLVKKKGLYYYKNNRIGSKENRNAKVMHEQFKELLCNYQISDKKYLAPMKEIMYYTFKAEHEARIQEAQVQREKLIEINAKLDRLEERFVFEEITQIQYDKFKQKLEAEKHEIEENLHKDGFDLSNLEKAIDLALQYSLQLPQLWSSGDLEVKRSIQNMVFPVGILYDFKNGNYRTERINSIFSVIPSLSDKRKDIKKGNEANVLLHSRLVARGGLEPSTSAL
ncbi:MAG: recombinase family protein [Bacteroidetes bacterium]|jgi:site-specific DNA recombinase|nr:recombinase family protein [Bacteroidota bacterium]MBT5530620.1 recombinase family protein [Cytophagia bacterium]MBT4337859.1 recombinase family protein [Bacteroidota bacterium]MBT4727252.1 recombinase family protein [Bacteroidota bacterium]MBT5991875.1 recombinase family protein [Bacteroidota bacterium]